MPSEDQLRRRLQRLDDQIAAARQQRTVVLRQLPRHGVGRPAEKLPAAVKWLNGYLARRGGQAYAVDVFRDGTAKGHAEKTIRRAGDKLGVSRTPPGGGRNCVWSLPDLPTVNGSSRR